MNGGTYITAILSANVLYLSSYLCTSKYLGFVLKDRTITCKDFKQKTTGNSNSLDFKIMFEILLFSIISKSGNSMQRKSAN